MIISVVVDPNCFDDKYMEKPMYLVGALSLFEGIKVNGVMLDVPKRRLLKALSDKIKNLSSIKYRQRLRIWLEEIAKNKKTYLAIDDPDPDIRNTRDPSQLAAFVANKLQADALVTDRDFKNRVNVDADHLRVNDVSLSVYADNRVEKKREKFAHQLPPLDEMDWRETEDLFIRLVKHADWLRFYDRYIGKGKYTKRFRRSLDYVLSLWKEHGVTNPGAGDVEIITRPVHPERPDDDENTDALDKVYRQLVRPLQQKYPAMKPVLRVNKTGQGRFHARFLQTNHIIVSVDAGFDLLKGPVNGHPEFRDNTISIARGSVEHLKRYRKDAKVFPE